MGSTREGSVKGPSLPHSIFSFRRNHRKTQRESHVLIPLLTRRSEISSGPGNKKGFSKKQLQSGIQRVILKRESVRGGEKLEEKWKRDRLTLNLRMSGERVRTLFSSEGIESKVREEFKQERTESLLLFRGGKEPPLLPGRSILNRGKKGKGKSWISLLLEMKDCVVEGRNGRFPRKELGGGVYGIADV